LSEKRTRGFTFHLEYEYNADTKDLIEDLHELYLNSDEIISEAVKELHERHFGSSSTGTPPPAYQQAFSGVDETARKTIDELWIFFQEMKDKFPQAPAVPAIDTAAATSTQNALIHFSEEANEKILEKIEDLGMRFSKIISEGDKKTGEKIVTAEMSNEEVLQLIKRIDKLESKLTKAISQSRVPASTGGGTGRRELRDFGEAPKIGVGKPIEGRSAELEDRPLLEDILDSVIVSVEKEEE